MRKAHGMSISMDGRASWIMCLWNDSGGAKTPRAYKADGILCVLYPEGSHLGRQQGKNILISQLQHAG